MSKYWSADDSMKVGETKVSIPSENGLEYDPSQKVQFFIPPTTKFMDGRETYLEFNVKLSLPSGGVPTRLQLDKCSSTLIKNIRVYDGTRGNLIEEISNYDSYVAVKYDYEKDASIENLRALREGCLVQTTDNRSDSGTTKNGLMNTTTNPYFKRTTGNQNASLSDADFVTAKVCIPLHTGVFANSQTIFPLMLTQGLYMEIDLNEAENVIKQLDSVLRDRRTPANPFFHSINGSSTPNTWENGDDYDTFYVDTDNNLDGSDRVARFPFVVGETFKFCHNDNNGSSSGFTTTATINEINLSTAANGGAGLIQIVLDSAVENNGSDIGQDYVMYSTAVAEKSSYDASYKLSNVNLVVSQVHLDPAYENGMISKVREGGAIEFDIMSLTNYKHSILSSDRQTNMQIFANNSRAKSLLIVPQDNTVYTSAEKISGSGTYVIKGSNFSNTNEATKDDADTCLASNRSAYTGIIDDLSSIQYVIDGKRVPSREISTKKLATTNSLDAFHLYELEKCLDSAGITPKSFSAFMDNFVFGRSFSASAQNGAMDLRGRDLSVVLKYLNTTAPTKNKLFNSYIFHLRKLIIRDGSLEVQF
tara:strand:- start:1235 stop:3004 length:1770 start_codon:yes stop_codon:yes gene_type:complete